MLLYNNRWICLLPFARKPDPRRVSKQVSREPPQAWLFGLVRLAPQAEKRRRPSDKRRRPSQFSAPQAEKYAACCDLPARRAALAEQHVAPAARCSQRTARRRGLFAEACFFCFPFMRATTKGGVPRPAPAQKKEGHCPAARRSPFGGGAGRRPPCPNGALLEKNGRVTRREEAAGASRWGLGSRNRPLRRWAENTGRPAPGIFRPVSGPNSYGKPPTHWQVARQGGSMAAVEAPFS